MSRVGLLAAAAVVAAAPVAHAERIVVADGDAELARAIQASLAPWKADIVIDANGVRDAGNAVDRADQWRARFVVWREGDQLAVLDRKTARVERRASKAGPLSPPDAAAAALSVKTMLRLPPPGVAEQVAPDGTPVVPGGPPPRLWLVAIGVGIAGPDFATRTAERFAVQPRRGLGFTAGLAGESAITGASVDADGFTGIWTTLELAATAGWTVWLDAARAWQVEGALGLGFARASLSGTESPQTPRSDANTFFAGMGLLAVRRAIASGFSVGLEARGWLLAGSHTYTRTTGMGNGNAQTIYQMPGMTESLVLTVGFQL